ncbi:MAG: stage II sporulation protein P [Clostridiales bacterium]|jgi:stage II sporulation protein P|nr:stage II sporulation protein P [Clostridiales bacterium]
MLNDINKILKFGAHGVAVSFIILTFFLFKTNSLVHEVFLCNCLPFYSSNINFDLNNNKNFLIYKNKENNKKKIENKSSKSKHKKNKEVFNLSNNLNKINFSSLGLENLYDLDYLKKNFYACDENTELTCDDLNIKKIIDFNPAIDIKTDGPKILIFHTHSTEMFCDSNEENIFDGVVGLGRELNNILNKKYKIKTIHDISRYDLIDGKADKRGAYDRMEENVNNIIKNNPSIEISIDIHRDGVDSKKNMSINLNEKRTAKLMLVNGLCRLKKDNKLEKIDYLSNKYIENNLAFSFKFQVLANKIYPDLMRKVYIKPYRYSLNMLPKSLLIEVGAQTNTKEEALNSIYPLADILTNLILE